jgi:hypothetical protein
MQVSSKNNQCYKNVISGTTCYKGAWSHIWVEREREWGRGENLIGINSIYWSISYRRRMLGVRIVITWRDSRFELYKWMLELVMKGSEEVERRIS